MCSHEENNDDEYPISPKLRGLSHNHRPPGVDNFGLRVGASRKGRGGGGSLAPGKLMKNQLSHLQHVHKKHQGA